MNTIEFDPTQKLLEFHYPDLDDLSNIKDDLVSQVDNWAVSRMQDKNSGFEMGMANQEHLIPPFNEKLYRWLNECLAEATKFYFPDKNLKMAICDAWLTQGQSTQTVSAHIHERSHLTGILYLTENNSQTIFDYVPRETDFYSQTLGLEYWTSVKVNSQLGKLIIYPSRIRHSVRIMPGQKNIRYTYVFNSFATGLISAKPASFLEYHVVTIKDRYLNFINKQEPR